MEKHTPIFYLIREDNTNIMDAYLPAGNRKIDNQTPLVTLEGLVQ